MKIPISWLSEYVDLKGITDAEISDALTMSGTENEIVRGTDFPKIVIGEIKEIQDHPDADRLHVTKTDVGKANGGVLQIVCGAPNIEVGQKVPVALVGAMIGEFEIKEAKIRGVESSGMLCSESELGISEDHSGIMVLDPRAKVGAPLADALNIGGTVLEAEITPNRSDCFSMVGIAGEAAAALGRKMKNRSFSHAQVKSKKKVAVKVTEKKLCPRYIAKVVEGIKIGPSPKWMQEKLEACGVRPINNVVDVTNYVMLEWGQPMHAFDAKKVSGGINIRLAKKGEECETLDGMRRKLTEKDLVIADDKKAIAVAGVMGGANSEVDEKTTTVVLEAAVFEGTSVRKTAQRLGLRTEASNRFEKGVPLALPELAIERAAGLLTEIPGGLAGEMPVVKPQAGENSDNLSAWVWIQHVGLRLSRVKNFLGKDIPTKEVIRILESLGFVVDQFDFKKEARSHVGKPYVLGASFKTHQDLAFDCSYLTDYIYSKVGQFVGHTCLAQFELGTPVEREELAPGDILFIKGHIETSATDHYYIRDGAGGHQKVDLASPKEVGHCALYVGGGRIVHASHYAYDTKSKRWTRTSTNSAKVVEEDVEKFLNHPEYLGARRYVDDPGEWLAITVPWWRLDVKIEEDILEEIGRIYGFENIPSRLPEGKLPIPEGNEGVVVSLKLKGILSGAGFSEVYNYSFVSAKDLENIGVDPKSALKISNPISPEQEYMRTNLVPSLLKNMAVNQFNFEDIRIFEIANSYLPQKFQEPGLRRLASLGGLPLEELWLGVAVRIMAKNKAANFEAAKGMVELIADKFRVKDAVVKPASLPYANPGQAIDILGPRGLIATVFVPTEKVRKSFGVKTEVAIVILNPNSLSLSAEQDIVYEPVSRFPQVVRDASLVFAKKVMAGAIQEILNKETHGLVKEAEISDIYESDVLLAGKKSVTIRMVFGAPDATLSEEQIKTSYDQIVLALQKNLGGQLR